MKTIQTTDCTHGARIMRNGGDGDYMAFAVQCDGRGSLEYWYIIGEGYKTEEAAIRYAKRSLAKHGYVLQEVAT